MATTTPNFGWSVPTSSDLVKNGAVAIETLGDSIDASFVDLKGGTTGQVLAKATGTDLDFTWSTVSAGSPNNATSFISGSQAVTGTSYVDLATSQSVTLTTGTKALVVFSCQYENGASSLEAYMSFGVTGATTSAATDARASKLFTGAFAWVGTLSQGFIMTGLTAGSNTFTTKFRMQTGGSMGFNNRYISVIDMGS